MKSGPHVNPDKCGATILVTAYVVVSRKVSHEMVANAALEHVTPGSLLMEYVEGWIVNDNEHAVRFLMMETQASEIYTSTIVNLLEDALEDLEMPTLRKVFVTEKGTVITPKHRPRSGGSRTGETRRKTLPDTGPTLSLPMAARGRR